MARIYAGHCQLLNILGYIISGVIWYAYLALAYSPERRHFFKYPPRVNTPDLEFLGQTKSEIPGLNATEKPLPLVILNCIRPGQIS